MRDVKTWMLAGGALAAGVALGWTVRGSENPPPIGAEKEIRAERFVLVGSDGSERAELVSGDDGSVWLSMYDQAGTRRVKIGLDGKSNAKVLLRNENDKTQAALYANNSGVAGVSLFDEEVRVSLSLQEEGRPELVLYAADAISNMVLALDGSDLPRFELFGGGDHRTRFRLGAWQDSSSTMTFFDAEGRPSVALGAGNDGAAGMDLIDARGRRRLVIERTPSGNAYIDVTDERETVRGWFGIGPDGLPRLKLNDASGEGVVDIEVEGR